MANDNDNADQPFPWRQLKIYVYNDDCENRRLQKSLLQELKQQRLLLLKRFLQNFFLQKLKQQRLFLLKRFLHNFLLQELKQQRLLLPKRFLQNFLLQELMQRKLLLHKFLLLVKLAVIVSARVVDA